MSRANVHQEAQSSGRIAMHGFNEFDRLSLLSDPGTSSPPSLGERLTFRVRRVNEQGDDENEGWRCSKLSQPRGFSIMKIRYSSPKPLFIITVRFQEPPYKELP
jgi:hypothetical protein